MAPKTVEPHSWAPLGGLNPSPKMLQTTCRSAPGRGSCVVPALPPRQKQRQCRVRPFDATEGDYRSLRRGHSVEISAGLSCTSQRSRSPCRVQRFQDRTFPAPRSFPSSCDTCLRSKTRTEGNREGVFLSFLSQRRQLVLQRQMRDFPGAEESCWKEEGEATRALPKIHSAAGGESSPDVLARLQSSTVQKPTRHFTSYGGEKKQPQILLRVIYGWGLIKVEINYGVRRQIWYRSTYALQPLRTGTRRSLQNIVVSGGSSVERNQLDNFGFLSPLIKIISQTKALPEAARPQLRAQES